MCTKVDARMLDPELIRACCGHPTMIVGAYGSGKTEVTVNLAIAFRAAGYRVSIADLDIVNAYFRCREARALMERRGIRVVVPPATHASSDLPMILPEIRGLLSPEPDEICLLDVGGDPVGAKLLSSFNDVLADARYELWQVINVNRPFTEDLAGCVAMRDQIERASRLRVTGLLANTHLMDETTPAMVLAGYRATHRVSEATGIPVKLVAAMAKHASTFAELAEPVGVLALERHMRPPWLRPGAETPRGARADFQDRPAPIGRP